MAGVLFDGIAYGSLLFLVSLGLAVTLGLMNFVNLAHGAFAMVGGYVAVMYPTIAYRLGELTPDRVLLGSSAVLLVLEAARRLAGGTLAWVALACILYAKFAWLFPSLLYAKGSSWSRIVSYLYLDTNGVFGVPLQVAASVLVAFIFFGHALYAVRGDRFLMEIALVLMGRYRGGAAKVSVVSSALMEPIV